MLNIKHLTIYLFGFFLLNLNQLFADTSNSCELYFRKLKTCAHIVWTSPPKKVQIVTEKDKAAFDLMFFKKHKSSELVAPRGELKVKLYMPSMGHGSHPTQIRSDLDKNGNKTGKFYVENVYFTMPGKWEIQVELKENEKLIDRAVLQYLM